MWNGQYTRQLHIFGEQPSDEILFAQCIPEAQARVGRVVIECNERMMPIFARSFDCEATPRLNLVEQRPGMSA
jgi:hypothetical protein